MRKKTLILFSVICIFLFVVFIVFNFVLFPTKYKNYVVKYSNQYDLDKALVYAVIKAESNFDKNATSKSGAMGLMQLIEPTAKWIANEFNEPYDETRIYNPETNIKYGCFYLRYLTDKFKNFDAVVCAYNAGEVAVRKWIDQEGNIDVSKINYEETAIYLKRVKGYFAIYKNHEICK